MAKTSVQAVALVLATAAAVASAARPAPPSERKPEPAAGAAQLLAEFGRGEAAEAIYLVGLWPTRSAHGQVTHTADELVAVGVRVEAMVPFLWRIQSARVVVGEGVPDGRFDLVVRPAGDALRVEPLGREALENGLGLDVRREVREVDAWVLRSAGRSGRAPAAGGLRESSREDEPRFDLGRGTLSGTRLPIPTLAAIFERELHRPVLDETGLTGEYEVDLEWTAGDARSLIEAIEKLGLRAVERRREVEMVVVRRRE